MGQEQALKKGPTGIEPGGQAFKAPERKAPGSSDVLKQLDGAIKQEAKVKDDSKQKLKDALSFDAKKRSILQRCGCL